MDPATSTVAADAQAAAGRAAAGSGVEIRELSGLADLRAALALYDRIWQPGEAGFPVSLVQLRALTHAGNYAAGAYRGGELVGACVGFFGAPPGAVLHSDVAGVAAGSRARSVGFALKLHQRAWALARGLREVTWTFDPLVRRNAYFNLAKLAARPREYLVDFYGDLGDAVNAGQGSDRLLVAWDLAAPEVAAACAGRRPPPAGAGSAVALAVSPAQEPERRPVPGGGPVLVQVPADIETIRERDPALARRWRAAVREALGGPLAAGARVTGFTADGGYLLADGGYLLQRGAGREG